MTRIIMCGCNGAMGRMITGIVNEDAEAEICLLYTSPSPRD